MKPLPRTLLLAIACASGTAQADEAALAKSRNCLACHAVDRKIVGPSYKDIARKYAGQKNIDALLADKILKGSKGAWGPLPMPPNPTVKPDEAGRLARWIIDQR